MGLAEPNSASWAGLGDLVSLAAHTAAHVVRVLILCMKIGTVAWAAREVANPADVLARPSADHALRPAADLILCRTGGPSLRLSGLIGPRTVN